MKKITMFLTIALFCAQIVKGSDIKDATLKNQGSQNEASTIAWLQSVNPDASLINMSISSFNKEMLKVLNQFNQKYGTFSPITSSVINEQILPQLYTANLDPNKLYRLSSYNMTTSQFGSWNRKAKPGETGLFFPGWEEPIMSVWCWNFGYPSTAVSAVIPAPVIPQGKTEYVYIAGSRKVITYEPDTVEINRSKVQIERNDIKTAVFTNNNRYEVNMEREEKRYSNSSCDCPQREEVRYKTSSCGCNEKRICENHYEQLPKKDKKNFFNTTGGRIFTHTAAAIGGYFLGRWIFGDNNVQQPGQIITQGPLDLFQATNPVYTQAGLSVLN